MGLASGSPCNFPFKYCSLLIVKCSKPETKRTQKNAKVRQRTRKSTQRLAKVNSLLFFPKQCVHNIILIINIVIHSPIIILPPPYTGVSCRDNCTFCFGQHYLTKILWGKSSQDDLQNWRRFSWRI